MQQRLPKVPSATFELVVDRNLVLCKMGPLNLYMFAWAIHCFKVETCGYMINILKAFHTVLENQGLIGTLT